MAGLHQPSERPLRRGHREQKWRQHVAVVTGPPASGCSGVLWSQGNAWGGLAGEKVRRPGGDCRRRTVETLARARGTVTMAAEMDLKMAKLMLHPECEQNPVSTFQ